MAKHHTIEKDLNKWATRKVADLLTRLTIRSAEVLFWIDQLCEWEDEE